MNKFLVYQFSVLAQLVYVLQSASKSILIAILILRALWHILLSKRAIIDTGTRRHLGYTFLMALSDEYRFYISSGVHC